MHDHTEDLVSFAFSDKDQAIASGIGKASFHAEHASVAFEEDIGIGPGIRGMIGGGG
jgi:hypothetical protein